MTPDRSYFVRTRWIFLAFLLVAIVIIILVIGYKTWRRQWYVEHEVPTHVRTIDANRGNIYSKNGTLLSTSVATYTLHFDPLSPPEDVYNKGIDALCDSLTKMFHGTPQNWKKKLSRTPDANGKVSRYVRIGRNISIDQYMRIKSFPVFNAGKYKGGLIVDNTTKRVQPYGWLASRLIGYSRPDLANGRVGLEGAYEEHLRGQEGQQVVRRVAGNVWIPSNSAIDVEPVDGDDIYTSIDMDIQDVAESALLQCLQTNEADKGCVIVMEVETGMVQAMVSLSKNKKTGTFEEMYNFAISENVEPGSTFKAITMTAVLEDNPNFNINKVIHLGKEGRRRFGGHVLSDSHIINGGDATVKQCFAESSNIAFAQIVTDAFEKRPQAFIDLIYKTKINEPLNLDILGEGKPYIKTTKKNWWGTSLSRIAIGYEVQLCPIHLLTYYNAIANNGRMLKPQFVQEIRRDDDVIFTAQPIVINEHIASEKTIKTLQTLLREVVVAGTAKNLSKCYFTAAGKTGTAHIASGKDGYDRNYTASFVGYFPAEKPKYSCIVVVKTSGKRYFGASVSLPVFKDIAERVYATNLDFADDETQGQGVLTTDYRPFNTNQTLTDSIVPDVVGLDITTALPLLEKQGFKVTFKGCGAVKSQIPAAGEKVDENGGIELLLH